MKNNAGIWIDHRKAVVVFLNGKDHQIKQIDSNVEKHQQRAADSVPGGSFESQSVPADNSQQREYTAGLKQYYKEVASSCSKVESVLIFGPGEAKGELKKYFQQEKVGSQIVGVETADKMTDAQIIAKVKQLFMK